MIAQYLALIEGKIANIVRGKSFVVRATVTATFTEHYVMHGTRVVRREKESRLACREARRHLDQNRFRWHRRGMLKLLLLREG